MIAPGIADDGKAMLSVVQLGKDFGYLPLECCVLSGEIQKLAHGQPPQNPRDGSLAHDARSVGAEWLWGRHAMHRARIHPCTRAGWPSRCISSRPRLRSQNVKTGRLSGEDQRSVTPFLAVLTCIDYFQERVNSRHTALYKHESPSICGGSRHPRPIRMPNRNRDFSSFRTRGWRKRASPRCRRSRGSWKHV